MELKIVRRPLGYNGCKELSIRTTKFQQEETKSLCVPGSLKIQIGQILNKVKEWKDNGKPLEEVAIIKAFNGIKKDAVINGVNNKKKVEEDKETEI